MMGRTDLQSPMNHSSLGVEPLGVESRNRSRLLAVGVLATVTLAGCSNSDGDSSPDDSTATASGGLDAGTAGADASDGDATTGSDTTQTAGDPSDSGADSASDSGAGGEGPTNSTLDELLDVEVSDEFDDPATLDEWTRLSDVEGTEAPYDVLDIDESAEGRLTLIPRAGGWYNDFSGPFLFKTYRGDFILETSVLAGNVADLDAPPTENFNSAGLMLRDPASGTYTENWVIHNVGMQNGAGVATETKTTTDSVSALLLFPGPNRGRLRICRFGDQIIMARKLDGESEFTETHRYTRDFPDTMQVGMMSNGWNSLGPEPDFQRTPDVHAEFDYVRFYPTSDESLCLAD